MTRHSPQLPQLRGRALVAFATVASLFGCAFAVAQDAPTPLTPPLPRVLIETSVGTMTVEADVVHAPITAGDFLKYVAQKRLDGVVFYRVVKVQDQFGFVQFGPQGDPERVLPPIKHEPTTQTGLSHTDGVLSVARLEPGTARGEFTIMVGDQRRGLDAGNGAPADNLGYAAFGRVVEGREVLVRILDTPVDPEKNSRGAFKGEMPGDPVRIIRAVRLATPASAGAR